CDRRHDHAVQVGDGGILRGGGTPAARRNSFAVRAATRVASRADTPDQEFRSCGGLSGGDAACWFQRKRSETLFRNTARGFGSVRKGLSNPVGGEGRRSPLSETI